MKEISFRLSTEEDREFVAQLSASVFSVYGDYDQILTHWFSQTGVITVIGLVGGNPAGFAMLQLGEKGDWDASSGELLALAVIPEKQRQGVGQALLRYMENLAGQFDLTEIHLHTAKDNLPARVLFQKAGYMTAGAKKSFYPKGQTAVMMVKMLDS